MSDPVNEMRTCPTCFAQVPAGSPGGACPRCLLAAGFATGAPGTPPVPDVTPAEVEQRFPQYAVGGMIGRGGMGIVFRARQKALDREVALKVLPITPQHVQVLGADFAERFQREARALARLQHPGIVQVHDFGVAQDGWCFLAMELVEGKNLRTLLAERRLPPRDALAIVPQICDALQYAHEHGVVHRDIKPENVLIDAKGRVKIADFGLAKLAGKAATDPTLTRTGLVMGTPHYMAPEQIEHPADVDHRADIYSLGVVFYEMLTGELPIGRFPPPSRRSDVTARIDEIVHRTLEKEREMRYQSADAVKTEVAAAQVAPPPLPAAGEVAGVPTPAPYPDHRKGWLRPRVPEPAAAPREPVALRDPPRLSKFAVFAACAPVLIGCAALGTWYSTGGEWPDRMVETSIVTLLALFAGVVVAVVAWGRVRHSGGKLYGRRFAFLALFACFIAPGVAIPGMVMGYDKWDKAERAKWNQANTQFQAAANRDAKPNPLRLVDGVTIPTDTPEEEVGVLVHGPRIRALFDKVVKIWPTENPALLPSVYGAEEMKIYSQLEPSVIWERRHSGTIGLPVTEPEFLGAPLATFHITAIQVGKDRRTGSIEISDGKSRFRAPVYSPASPHIYAPCDWFFSLGPVERVVASVSDPSDLIDTLRAPTPADLSAKPLEPR